MNIIDILLLIFGEGYCITLAHCRSSLSFDKKHFQNENKLT